MFSNVLLSFLFLSVSMTQPIDRMNKEQYITELGRFGLNKCEESCALDAFDCIIQRDKDENIVTYKKSCVMKLDNCEKECFDSGDQQISTKTTMKIQTEATAMDLIHESTTIKIPVEATTVGISQETTAMEHSKETTTVDNSHESTPIDVAPDSNPTDVSSESTTADIPHKSTPIDISQETTPIENSIEVTIPDIPQESTVDISDQSTPMDYSSESTPPGLPQETATVDIPKEPSTTEEPHDHTSIHTETTPYTKPTTTVNGDHDADDQAVTTNAPVEYTGPRTAKKGEDLFVSDYSNIVDQDRNICKWLCHIVAKAALRVY